METTLLSSKGQIITPKTIRSSHNWKPGTRFVVEDTQGGILLKPLDSFPVTELQSSLGCIGYKGTVKSLDEIQTAIDDAVANAWREEQ
jgi:AbrB family looped-hinge helix DNA binding protein